MVETTPSGTRHCYVSFLLGEETYALDVREAREIVDLPALRRLPNAPPWIVGVMDLRGAVVPVVDLEKKLGIPRTGGAAAGYVVVVVLQVRGQELVVGVLADAVLDVFELAADELGRPPAFGARFSRSYLRGTTDRDGQLVLVLEATRVLADRDVRRATAA
ncbi:MAG: chemotaxis protein CheW [Myxococcales bacterium]|nr:chemotaxis protein CheW [Myxococcales bacterium]